MIADDGQTSDSAFQSYTICLYTYTWSQKVCKVIAESSSKTVQKAAIVHPSIHRTQRAQYGLVKEYTSNHSRESCIIPAVFLK